MSLSDHDFLKWIAKDRLIRDALNPSHELYEPLYKDDPGDPIELIYRDISFTEVESINFLSGFRGCGKSTELNRLREKLKDDGYAVVYIDALDYFLPNEPVEIATFLLVLAGAFGESLEETLDVKLGKDNAWQRIVHFLTKTNVTLEGLDLKAGSEVAALNFKFALREAESVRAQVEKAMQARLGELRNEVRSIFADGRERLLKKETAAKGVVVVLDNLEQLRDSLGTGSNVTLSIETLFGNHRRDLEIPSFHMVYTVPPWLKFRLQNLPDIRILYTVKLWENNAKRLRSKRGIEAMRKIVERRFTPEGMTRFFGKKKKDGTWTLADRLIDAAGGEFPRFAIAVARVRLASERTADRRKGGRCRLGPTPRLLPPHTPRRRHLARRNRD